MTIVDLLEKIHPLVWSGISASVITLCGVMFSDWRNTKRLGLQHEFAEREAEKARMLALRKEVYLPVAGALGDIHDLLFTLPMREFKPGEKTAAGVLGEALGKVAMVATTETAILAQELSTDYGAAHIRLTVRAAEIADGRASARMFEKFKEKAQAEFDRVVLDRRKEAESGACDAARLAALDESGRFAWSEVQRYSDEEIRALEQVSVRHTAYLTHALNAVRPLTERATRLMIAMRSELGLHADFEQFVAALKRSEGLVLKEMQAAMESLRASAEKEQSN